eukprot:m51a1_g1352 putative glycoside hydrolase (557) ;mRNA; f:356688-358460
MRSSTLVLAAALFGCAVAQQSGWSSAENKPRLNTFECTASGCNYVNRAVTMDANWRWLHKIGGTANCYTGNSWDTNSDACPDPDSCAKNCALDGCDYQGTYGVTANNDALTLSFVTQGTYSKNIGSRLFMMEDDTRYKMYKLINREFAFDVDVSQLPCGLNGALYFSEMAENGGMGVGNNNAGARFGTGYCDAQCPHDIKFINGAANIVNWQPSSSDRNAGTGKWGSCCGEMDIWESNQMSSAVTPHNCNFQGQKRCEDPVSCGDSASGNRYNGVCDKDGCDWNSYRMGDKDFFGPGKTVDTTKSFSVITQFITSDNTDNGDLVEIRRFYKQNGNVIANSFGKINGLTSFNSISDKMCKAQKSIFGDRDDFTAKGGMKTHGEMLRRGMVLVLSLWDDHDVNMLWLDSNMPATADASKPGVARGSCPTTSGKPTDVESQSPNARVVFSNIKYGTLGSTTPGVPAPSSHSSSAHTQSSSHPQPHSSSHPQPQPHSSSAHAHSSSHPQPQPHSSSAQPHPHPVHSSSTKCPTHSDDFFPGSASAVAVGAASFIALAAQF